MKSTTYFAEITNEVAEKYLLTSYQLWNFPHEFNENCFAFFDQSSRAIYLTWYRSLLFFPEFTLSFLLWYDFKIQVKSRGWVYFYVQHHLLTFGRNNFLIKS